jgi:pyruvate dehydrogenase E2 component (dihydrolipoamide acetyltransferase)
VEEIFTPALGMAAADVYLAEWVKRPGDTVAAGDVIALIETDKAEMEIEAPSSGTLGTHLFPAESTVVAGATIVWLLQPGDADPGAAGAGGDSVASVRSAAIDGKTSPRQEPSRVVEGHDHEPADSVEPIGHSPSRLRDPVTGELEPHTLSPRARAADRGERVAPQTAQDSTPRVGEGPDRYRAAIAAAVSRSWADIPHFTVSREIRVEKLQDVLRSFRAIDGGITFSDVLLKAYALSLVARFETTSIDLGLAVATERGVAIPVLLDVARTDLVGIARLRRAAVDRARSGRTGSTDGIAPHSTVSNLGTYGVDSFTGIVPAGQTSLLTIGTAAQRPVIERGVLAVGTTMHTTMNLDHRTWDGRHAAETLQRFAAIAAEPAVLVALS